LPDGISSQRFNFNFGGFSEAFGEKPLCHLPWPWLCRCKLLDRVLFCAFCEDRGLLPAESLKRAFQHRDPYDPKPLWQNFRGLFRAIDEGNAGLNIPAYNGGLFASDPSLDALPVRTKSAVISSSRLMGIGRDPIVTTP
jgi:hypothetical protein